MQCEQHPEASGGWSCRGCGKTLCETCIRKVAAGRSTLIACNLCGGVASEIRTVTPGSTSSALLDDLRRPFGLDGLVMAGTLAIVSVLVNFVGSFLAMAISTLITGAFICHYFLTIAHIGDGKPGLPMPSVEMDDWQDLLGQAGRGFLCMFVLILPFVLWTVLASRGWEALYERGFEYYVFFLVGCSYFPAALISSVATESPLAVLWPPVWFTAMRRIGSDYPPLVLGFVISMLVLTIWSAVGTHVLHKIPLIGPIASQMGTYLFLLVQASLLGSFLYRHREALEYE